MEQTCSCLHLFLRTKPGLEQLLRLRTEIKQYFKDFASKYELMPYVRLDSKVLSAVWENDQGICRSVKPDHAITLTIKQMKYKWMLMGR